jgi:general secretion pathway protein G
MRQFTGPLSPPVQKKSFRAVFDQAGMTLIEIMIVLAIVGGLMAVLGSRFIGQLEKSRVSNVKIQIKEISKQLDMYNTECSNYPTTEQGLQALIQSPGEDACPNWGPEPYLKKEPKDPWNRTFIYESDGTSFTLKSLGKDKKEGGEGYDKDISSEEI